MVKNSTRVMCT